MKYASGKSEWLGPDSMDETLNSDIRKVRSVAFGEDWDTFFIVFEDGGWHHNGNLPVGLSNLAMWLSYRNVLHTSNIGHKKPIQHLNPSTANAFLLAGHFFTEVFSNNEMV